MKTYGKPKNGMVRTMPYYKIPFFKLFSGIQYFMWKYGITYKEYNLKISIHIPLFGGQCTPDFSCCRWKQK